MSTYADDFSKYLHPDFADPGIKPKGPVEIDHTAAIPPPDHLYGFSNAGRLLDFVGGVHSDTFAGNTRIQRNRIVFDGTTGSQVSFPDTDHAGNSSIFCDRPEFTVSTIVNFTTGNGGIIGDYYTVSNVSCLLWVSSSGYIYFRARCGGVVKTINGTTNIVDGKDHTIIAQYNGANMYLIVDGKQVATTTQSGNTNGGFTARLGIGSYSGVWSGNVPVGAIDHVAIWWSSPKWQAIAESPYAYLKPANPITYFIPSAGSGAAALIGSASGTALATSALTTAIKLLGSASGSATANATDLITQIRLQGAISGSATTSAEITTAIQLLAAVSGSAIASGALTVAGAIELIGAANGTSSVSSELTTAIQLLASVTGTTSISGSLDVASLLAGIASGTSSISSSLTTGIVLGGGLSGSSATSGALQTAIVLLGDANGTSSVDADIQTAILLVGDATGSAAVSGDFGLLTQLAAAITGSASVGGDLTTQIQLLGSSYGPAIVSGALLGGTSVVNVVAPSYTPALPPPVRSQEIQEVLKYIYDELLRVSANIRE